MRILVPTDFSTYADLAIKAAKRIGHKYNAQIDLYHSIDSMMSWQKANLSDTRLSYLAEIEANLETMKKELVYDGFQSKYFVGTGKFINDLKSHIKLHNYDMVIMGSHGAHAKEEWFLGTNTQRVIRKIHSNVLVIKKDFEKLDFSEVLFVTALDKEDQAALEYFLNFIKPFDVKKVHILAVDTAAFYSQPTVLMLEALKDFKAIAGSYDTETHFYSDYSVDAGVRHFSKDNGIDLIAMSNHSRRPIKRMFQGSNVEIIVNHSNLPVLTIDYTK